MDPTEKRALGRTQVKLTQLGYGAAPLGELFERVSEEQSTATMRSLWGNGIRYFDTAPLYGFGLSEHRVGSFLFERPRNEFVISTKVGRILKAPEDKLHFKPPIFLGGLPYDHHFDYSYDGIMRSFEDSLQRLRLTTVDLLVIHDLELCHHGDRLQSHMEQLSRDGWRALENLRSTGEIRAIGAGINERGAISRFLDRFDIEFFVLAFPYTLLDQDALDELPICEERNVGIIVATVFGSGVLVTGPVEGAKYNYLDAPEGILERVSRIQRVCLAHGVSMAAAALQFPLAHPCVTTVIPGSLHPRQVEQNLAYFREQIPAQLWEDLKAERLVREDAPTPMR